MTSGTYASASSFRSFTVKAKRQETIVAPIRHMLEVNRRVYCKKDGRKSERFSAVQRDIQELLAYLEMLTNLK